MNEMDIQPWLIRMSQGDEEAFQTVYDLTRDQAFGNDLRDRNGYWELIPYEEYGRFVLFSKERVTKSR